MSRMIYFDHNATTPVDSEVLGKISELSLFWGNPSSIHKSSREPKAVIRDTRKKLSEFLNTHPLEIIFTSGGSESNNTIIKGVFFAFSKLGRKHFITTQVEHPSVMKSFDFLKTLGAQVDYIPVDKNGVLDLNFYKEKLSDKTALVSVMLANNETGVIHPIKEMCELAHLSGALFHTDAVQALGKIPVDLKYLGVDFASFASHKFYSLKGTGIIYQKKGVKFENLIHGGGQERGRRAGTENTLSIGSFFEVLKKKDLILEKNKNIESLRDFLEDQISKRIPHSKVIAKNNLRLPNTSMIFLNDVDGETLLMNLDMEGICVSTGAACSSGSQEPSATLQAMGFSRKEAQCSLRVSLGYQSTMEEVVQFLDALEKVVYRIRSFKNFESEALSL